MFILKVSQPAEVGSHLLLPGSNLGEMKSDSARQGEIEFSLISFVFSNNVRTFFQHGFT